MINRLITLALSIIVLMGLLVFTNPFNSHAVVLAIPFILIFIISYECARLYLAWSGSETKGVPQRVATAKKRATFFAIFATALIALQTMGQLTVRDIIIMLVLMILGYFYLQRITAV